MLLQFIQINNSLVYNYRFGWFGLKANIPASEVLNYLGVVICLIRFVHISKNLIVNWFLSFVLFCYFQYVTLIFM